MLEIAARVAADDEGHVGKLQVRSAGTVTALYTEQLEALTHFSAPAGAAWHKASATSSPASALSDAMPLMAANIRSFDCMVRMNWASPDCHNARRLCIDEGTRNITLNLSFDVFSGLGSTLVRFIPGSSNIVDNEMSFACGSPVTILLAPCSLFYLKAHHHSFNIPDLICQAYRFEQLRRFCASPCLLCAALAWVMDKARPQTVKAQRWQRRCNHQGCLRNIHLEGIRKFMIADFGTVPGKRSLLLYTMDDGCA